MCRFLRMNLTEKPVFLLDTFHPPEKNGRDKIVALNHRLPHSGQTGVLVRTSGVNQNDGFKSLVVCRKLLLEVSALVESHMVLWRKAHVSQN